ncbi:MAG: FHA domain-containing protein [Phycisphaerales bacterium JB039]
MTFSLVLVKDDGSTKEIRITRSRIIGREEECDLRIPAPTVSREHCEVVVEPGQPPQIKDLASSNGTFVNGNQVDEAELHAGDVLSIGPANFVIRIDGQPAQIDQQAVAKAAAKALAASAATDGAGHAPAPSTGRPSLLESDEDISKALDEEASGMGDFDFSMDDEDDQPPL